MPTLVTISKLLIVISNSSFGLLRAHGTQAPSSSVSAVAHAVLDLAAVQADLLNQVIVAAS